MNKFLEFSALMVVPGIFYGLASFYHLKHVDDPLVKSIAIAAMFATTEYIFKVPIIQHGYAQGLSRTDIQMIWIAITMAITTFIEKQQ